MPSQISENRFIIFNFNSLCINKDEIQTTDVQDIFV